MNGREFACTHNKQRYAYRRFLHTYLFSQSSPLKLGNDELLKRIIPKIIMVALLASMLASVEIQPAKAELNIYIRADGTVDPSTAPILNIDNVTYVFTDDVLNGSLIVERDNIVVDGAGHTLQALESQVHTLKGIQLTDRTNVTIKNFQIKKYCDGIYIINCTNVDVYGNNITDGGWGIELKTFSSNNRIHENNIIRNSIGIWLADSSNNTITGNYVTNSSLWGIFLGHSSKNNAIFGNNLISNQDHGIHLMDSSNNNSIFGNNIKDNHFGVFIYASSYNKFCHNNFITNTEQVHFQGSTLNFWDDGHPSGGNYWSDYNGIDLFSGPYQNETGSDGIGDTPYAINTNNIDRYPLMQPYGIQTCELTITATIGGTTDPTPGNYTFVNGTAISVTAIPDINYAFSHWILDGNNIGLDNPVEIVMNDNHTLSAVFVLRNYTLTITSTSGGVTEPPSGTYFYPATSTVNVTAVPDEGYIFDHWKLDNINVSSENPCTLTMDTNHTLNAIFSPEKHDIAIVNIWFSNYCPLVNETILIYVTVENQGNVIESFDVSVNYSLLFEHLIGTQTIILGPGETTTLNFIWTPTTHGKYEIKAYTSIIPDDINPLDNANVSYLYVSAIRRGGGAGRWAIML